MNFRDTFQDDLKAAFFNTDDFASKHVIDGVPMTVVIEKIDFRDAKTSYRQKSGLNPKENAINKECIILYINDNDTDRKKYTVNAMINLDGQDMFIYDSSHPEGMHRLVIGKHKV